MKKISLQEQIDTILDNFDFEAVRKAMVALKWTWVTSNQDDHIPSISEARANGRYLLNEVAKQKQDYAFQGTGGFVAEKFEGNRLELTFRIDHIIGADYFSSTAEFSKT